MRQERAGVRSKLRAWATRYLPAELLGTLTALVAAWTAHAASGSTASAAVAGAVGEGIGWVRRVLRPDGYLILGGAETALNVDAFERVPLDRATVYRLRGGQAAT
jgi:hypothetical protein